MSNKRDFGPALMEFVYAELDAIGTAPTTWARQHGLSPAQLKRWADGDLPRLDKVSDVADALGRPIVDLFAVMAGVEPGKVTRPAPTPSVSVETAIKNDDTLSSESKSSLRSILKQFRAHEARYAE